MFESNDQQYKDTVLFARHQLVLLGLQKTAAQKEAGILAALVPELQAINQRGFATISENTEAVKLKEVGELDRSIDYWTKILKMLNPCTNCYAEHKCDVCNNTGRGR